MWNEETIQSILNFIKMGKVTFDPQNPPLVNHVRRSTSCLEFNQCMYSKKFNPFISCTPTQKNNGSIPRFLVHQGVDIFRVLGPITSADASTPAYAARLWASYSKRYMRGPLFVIKCVNRKKDPEGERRLRAEVARIRRLSRRDRYFGSTCSLIECEQHFYHDDVYYCCVFPYDSYGASLSCVMRGPHAHTFPEQDHILFILYKTLQALDALHRLGLAHGSICAAHIYLTRGKLHRVKLGFAISVLDLAKDTESDSTSPYMPSASVCRLAAAPEVYGPSGAAATEEGDVWLVGITALELAYGGLRVTSRREIESIVTKINVERRLPKKLNEIEKSDTQHFPFCCLSRGRVFPVGTEHGSKVFSKGFMDLVVSCLDFRPAKRPTAAQLLCHRAFKTVESWDFLPKHLFPDNQFF